MTYAELKNAFRELKHGSPRKDLTAHIIFTEDSFAKPYPLLSRTYSVSSANKAFGPACSVIPSAAAPASGSTKAIKNGKIRLEPLAGNQRTDDEWTDLPMDRVYGYCTLLEQHLNERKDIKNEDW